MRLEPRGLLYVKLTLQEQWDPPSPRPSDQQPPAVFGLELRHLVDKEGSAFPVPLLIQKCVAEIEKRGLKVRLRGECVTVCLSLSMYMCPISCVCVFRGWAGIVYVAQLP